MLKQKKGLKPVVKLACKAILVSISIFLLLAFSQKRLLQPYEQGLKDIFFSYLDFSLLNFLRMARNLLISLFRGFTPLATIIFFYLLFRKRDDKKAVVASLLLILSLVTCGTVWSGDFMVRRIIFLAPLLALFLVKNLSKLSFVVLIYLILIMISNSLLYTEEKERMPLYQIGQMSLGLPQESVLVATHYLRPFILFKGETIWVGQSDLEKISGYLEKKQKVFLDSQTLSSPYLLFIGNNLHITSLSRFGESEVKELYKKYVFDLREIKDAKTRVFLYEIKKEGGVYEKRLALNSKLLKKGQSLLIGKAEPGASILIYSKKTTDRIQRRRIDYGDFLTWLWVIVLKRREPLAFTFADKDGVFIYPLEAAKVKDIFVVSKSKLEYTILTKKS